MGVGLLDPKAEAPIRQIPGVSVGADPQIQPKKISHGRTGLIVTQTKGNPWDEKFHAAVNTVWRDLWIPEVGHGARRSEDERQKEIALHLYRGFRTVRSIN